MPPPIVGCSIVRNGVAQLGRDNGRPGKIHQLFFCACFDFVSKPEAKSPRPYVELLLRGELPSLVRVSRRQRILEAAAHAVFLPADEIEAIHGQLNLHWTFAPFILSFGTVPARDRIATPRSLSRIFRKISGSSPVAVGAHDLSLVGITFIAPVSIVVLVAVFPVPFVVDEAQVQVLGFFRGECAMTSIDGAREGKIRPLHSLHCILRPLNDAIAAIIPGQR